MKNRKYLIATTAMSLVLGASQAFAAGLAVKETSGKQVGQAFAGAAALDGEVSAMWNNPATMTSITGNQFAVSTSIIIPSAKFKEGGSSNVPGSDGGDSGKNAVVPALYGMWDVEGPWKFGLAVTAPYGLVTEFDENWKGRFHAIRSELKSININPNLAYKFNEYVSLGCGFSVQYSNVELTKKINNATFGGAGEGDFKVDGNDWGYGYNLGVLVEPTEGTRIGLAYRSKVTHRLEGYGTARGIHANAAAAGIRNGKYSIIADFTTPDTIDLAVSQKLSDAWTLLGSVVWTRWSHFNELNIRNNESVVALGGAPSETIFAGSGNERQEWKNVFFFSVGANWKFSENYLLRLGAAFDQSPIRNEHRSPKLPGNDRTWLSAGLDWNAAEWIDLSLTYTHVFVKDGKINQTNGKSLALPAGNRLQGKVKSSVDIVGFQVNFKF